ncbi:MAG: hypothetical protein LBP76_14630 [Treponema sp.]|jgi:hypothetical protein|nr:hypothetical protein [Treponema sp.]
MALNGTGRELGGKIAALITAPDAPEDARQSIKKLWENIGEIIVTHLVTNAIIPAGIGVQVSPSTGSGKTNAPGSIQ